MKKTLAQQLEDWSMPEPNSGCYLWFGSMCGTKWKEGQGYGKLRNGGKDYRAHKVAWELAFGPIPVGLQVLHKCDMSMCVNPEHLFLGTNQENIDDKMQKGRHRSGRVRLMGILNGNAGFTEEQVREIRADRRSAKDIAQDYGVHLSVIYRVVNRSSYPNVL